MLDEQGEPQQVAVAHADPAKVEMAHELRKRYPPDPESPTGVRAIMRGGAGGAVPRDTRRDDRRGRRGRRAPAADPRARHALGDGGPDADRQPDAGRDHARVGRERARVRRRRSRVRGGPGAARRDRDPERTPVRGAGADRSHAAGEPAPRAAPRGHGWETDAAYQAGERGADVGGDFYDILPVDVGPSRRARRRHRQGHRGGRADVAGAPLGADGRSLRPAPGARARPRQPGAARAAAAVARDRRVRARGGRGRSGAASPSPRPGTRCRSCCVRARRRRRSATTACCSAWPARRTGRRRRCACLPATRCSSTPTA